MHVGFIWLTASGGSNSFLVGASKQQAASFREAYGRSGSEDDNASGGAGMIHLMAVGIWIWGSSFLFPQASIPVNSGW